MSARRIVVPLVVLAAAAALWLWPDPAGRAIVDLSDDVTDCAVNLREIYRGMLLYEYRPGERLPQRSGVAVLGALVAEGVLEDTPETRAHLTCPGPGAHRVPEDVDYRAPDALTGADSAYAVRDLVAFPMPHFPAGGVANEPLVACDNARGMNHEGCMNVLYSDGSVRTLLLAEEIERGNLPPGTTTIAVGKDSPLPDLRKLVGD